MDQGSGEWAIFNIHIIAPGRWQEQLGPYSMIISFSSMSLPFTDAGGRILPLLLS